MAVLEGAEEEPPPTVVVLLGGFDVVDDGIVLELAELGLRAD